MATESGRPKRKRVRKLTDEEINAILQSESEGSDVDDPDFVEEDQVQVLPSPSKHVPPKVESVPPTFPVSAPSPQVLDSEYRPVAVVKPSVTPTKTQATPSTTDAKENSYRCCVKSCVSGNLSDKDGLWLFPLPKSEDTLHAWEEHLQIDKEHNSPLSPRVCFRHFDKADFIRKQQRFVGLCEGAVPKCAATTSKPKPMPKPRQQTRFPTPVTFPQVVRLMPIDSQLGTPGHPGIPGAPIAPPVLPTPQVLLKGAPVPPPPTNAIIIPDDVKPAQKSVAYGKDGFVVTNGQPDSALEMMEIKIEPIDQMQEEDCGDGLTYTLTLEDIQEELPWVVPDNLWKSEMENGELVIVKEGKEVTRKVVIKDGLQLEVFIGGKRVDKFNKTILKCADDLKVVLEQVQNFQN
ncbi:uncharacterized protein LOC135392181 isoform X2 [Ornithodoros turicata]|uniref:uncharacterized protein LOC135392181 isoform X2 n=1 Tax=Ornithodoros turicata TaxID=34597 RepID=UPI003138722D